PQFGAGVIVIGAAHLDGFAAKNLFDDFGIAVDLFGGAVDVDQQDRGGVGGVAGVGVLLQADDAGVVEPFQRGGHGPGLDDGGYGFGRVVGCGEAAQQATRYWGDR